MQFRKMHCSRYRQPKSIWFIRVKLKAPIVVLCCYVFQFLLVTARGFPYNTDRNDSCIFYIDSNAVLILDIFSALTVLRTCLTESHNTSSSIYSANIQLTVQ